MRIPLRLLIAASGVLCAAVLPRGDDALAAEAPVPEKLQALLIAKVAAYDRSFRARAGERAQVVIVQKPEDTDSARAADHLVAALHDLPDVGGLPHEETIVPWTGATALPDLVRTRHAAVLCFTPDFSAEAGSIRAALDGVDVLSVTAMPNDVEQGIVLGFDLFGGKPKLLVNLAQARRQHVAFMAEVLKMAQVVQ